jgi:hypothetical protein
MSGTLPSNIDIANAQLPVAYKEAKAALSECARIDECKTWANKAAALATYAKMADDDSLRVMADRTQARAVSRMGDLLKQFNNGPGRPKDENRGNGSPISQAEAGRKAGLSLDQIKQAVRVANIPEDVFESLVESDNPPTVTAFAEMGKVRAVTAPAQEPSGAAERRMFGDAVRRLVMLRSKSIAKLIIDECSRTELRAAMDFLADIDVKQQRAEKAVKAEAATPPASKNTIEKVAQISGNGSVSHADFPDLPSFLDRRPQAPELAPAAPSNEPAEINTTTPPTSAIPERVG